MSEQRVSPGRPYTAPTQIIEMEPIDCTGLILDIGGGDDGVIGLLQKNVVIAIGTGEPGPDESLTGPVNVIMDATDMQFHAGTFDLAAAFFTLTCFPPEKRGRLFRECHRVLRPGGRFLIWDTIVPARSKTAGNNHVVPLRIRTPGMVIRTICRVTRSGRRQDVNDFIELASESGFAVIERKKVRQAFYLALRKSG